MINLWLQGLVDQSSQKTAAVLADAEAAGHPVSLALALTWCGCLATLCRGDIESAELSIARLKEHTEKYGLGTYHACALGFEGELSARRGDVRTGERLLRTSLATLREARYENLYTPFLSSLGELLMTAGRLDESLAVANEAVRRTERSHGYWWMPEALRIKGEVLLLSDQAGITAADDLLRYSVNLAHGEAALFWELRAATSLARLRRAQGRISEARDLLASVYGRFTEGFKTADLQAARRILDELHDAAAD